MKKNLFVFLIIGLMWVGMALQAQEQKYYPPTDSLVIRKLSGWQDLKFGLLMHWGTYSEWGIVESWSLCPEDEDWCTRRGPFAKDYFNYRSAYENLKTTFNPTQFNPDAWATAAQNAGMRYVVFTAKHHDGFCMFDTKFTHYKVTDSACPFSVNPKANILNQVFGSFRTKGFMVGAYFSKPDWHCPDYWDPYFPPFDRNPNYDITKYPDKWERYKLFTSNQIKELMTGYGRVDILWLDGGWVQPITATSPRWGKSPCNQDINMNAIVSMARSFQPGLIVVDRAVEGPNQNYLTPEQQIPDKPLPYPWETCMTMATSWSYVPHDAYKSARTLIQTLCTIVSRGGNLLLNIAPGPDGRWDSVAYERLAEIGHWMNRNSRAIYGTHPIAPYQSGNTVFTAKADTVFAIYLPGETEKTMPAVITLNQWTPKPGAKAIVPGYAKPLPYKTTNGNTHISIPAAMRKKMTMDYAWVFMFCG
ncbi:MAG: alpha-L-fucosidase [Bacteroidota bacterium]